MCSSLEGDERVRRAGWVDFLQGEDGFSLRRCKAALGSATRRRTLGVLDDGRGGRFVIDQSTNDEHATELRRQLDHVYLSMEAGYNKRLAFVSTNCGEPAFVYGKALINGIIDTLAHM